MEEKAQTEFTADQVVAWNFKEARNEEGLTHREVADRLLPYLSRKGKPWSRAHVHALENSWKSGTQTRHFNADHLFAFSMVFDRPPTWFLLPPPQAVRIKTEQGRTVEIGGREEDQSAVLAYHYLERLFLDAGAMKKRLEELGKDNVEWRAEAEIYDNHVREALGDLSIVENRLDGVVEDVLRIQEWLRKGKQAVRPTPPTTADEKAKARAEKTEVWRDKTAAQERHIERLEKELRRLKGEK